jgi:anaerobic magnesium-protoporphyrin IX monomethyl ester cyclase
MNNKILLLKPPYFHIPLGLAYVMANLEKHKIEFDFIDTAFETPNYRKLLKGNDYIAVASGGLSAEHLFFRQMISKVRSKKPDIPIILGGNITKDLNSEILFDKTKFGIDFGIIGEAETSFPFLIGKLLAGSNDFSDVPGLLYKDKVQNKIVRNNPKRFDVETENTFPAWHRIRIENYKNTEIPFVGKQEFMPIVTGRGCVGVCSFCSPTVGAFRKRPLKHIMEEIEFMFSHYDFSLLMFLNEMFYDTKEDIHAFCDAYKKVTNRKPWVCSMRADVDVDIETFKAMKDAGCVMTSAGIESGSDKVLQIMKKQTTTDQIKRFFRNVKQAGLPCCGTFMLGNEGENEEDLKQTIDMVTSEEMDCDGSVANAYTGTLIYKNAIKRGLIKDEWEHLQRSGRWGNYFYALMRKLYINISDIPDDR